MTDEGQVKLDLERQSRTGLAEAIFCEGKSPEQLLMICARVKANQNPMLFTRLAPQVHELLAAQYPDLIAYDPVSRTGAVQPKPLQSVTQVAIVSGGTSDVPVSREAAKTLEYYGHPALVIDDVGVAGLWRLTERVPEISKHKIVICVAGMDAALPTVLGGLIPSVMIAVPTSVGYGMVRGGETALQSLLVSCAPGITVVNIDNGYGAACAAIRTLNQLNNNL